MNRKMKIMRDLTLTVCFMGVLVTGVVLHLKKHGIIIEPRQVLKAIHYGLGFAMMAIGTLHVSSYFKLLKPLRAKYAFAVGNSVVLLAAFGVVALTGIVKLCSPVKIPHLGLWHYGLGLVMSLLVAIHLWRMMPWLIRKLKH